MIKSYFKRVGNEKLSQINSYKTGAWLHVEHATEEDINTVADLTGLDVIDLDDSLDRYEVPRIERQNGNVILFVRYPVDDIDDFYTDILTIVLTKNHIITISPTECPVISKIINNRINYATTQKTRFLINLLLLISNSYTTHVKQVRHHVISQKQKIKKSVTNYDIALLADNEEILNQYLAALIPMQNVIQATLSGHHIVFYEDDEDLLDDLLISSKQSEDLCTVNLKSIRSVRDSYQIIFSNKLNQTMKFLTSMTIILTIPTIVTSFYGMNISLPFGQYEAAYFIVIAISIFISVGILCLFYWKKWLWD